MSALDVQVDGDHYKKYPIQPVEFCFKNKLNNLQSAVIKYVVRYKDKGGVSDLNKAIHLLELLKEFEYGNDDSSMNQCISINMTGILYDENPGKSLR